MSFVNLFMTLNLAMICYTGMNSCGKEILSQTDNTGINLWEFSFFRSLFLTLTAALLIKRKNKEVFYIPPECYGLLFYRCLVGFCTFFLLTVPLRLIPLSVFQSVLSTVPFWIALLSFIMFKQKVECYKWITMIVAYVGIIIVSWATPSKTGSGEY